MAEEQKKYVVYGMRAKCSEGSMENYISTDVGHGVVYQGQPLLNANDHTPQVNLTHFGDCHSKLIYEEAKKQADEKYKADADDGFFAKAGKFIAKNVTKAALTAKEYLGANKCELDTPLPWMFGNSEHMIDGAPALTMESQCACRFGGIISIVPEEEEAAESIEEETAEAAEGAAGDAEGISAVNIAPVLAKGVLLTKAAENSTEEGVDGPWAGVTDAIGKALRDAAMAAKSREETEERETCEFVGYLSYGASGIVQDSNDGYYMLYSAPTLGEIEEQYYFKDLYEENETAVKGAMQAYGGQGSKLNFNGNTNYGGQSLDPYKGTLLYNGIERYAVAIGPKLQNPECDLDTYTGEDMAYGTCIDISIILEGQTYYIPAIIVDVKEHTAPSGVIQTGKTFKDNTNNIDKTNGGSIVEWYTVQKVDGTNKSSGLNEFSGNGSIIFYRHEVLE